MMDLIMEYIMPIFLIILMVFTLVILGLLVKDNFFDNKSHCICEKVSNK